MEWIKITPESMPAEGECIVYGKIKGLGDEEEEKFIVTPAFYGRSYDYKELGLTFFALWQVLEEDWPLSEVTHWQSLPSPPLAMCKFCKESKEDQKSPYCSECIRQCAEAMEEKFLNKSNLASPKESK